MSKRCIREVLGSRLEEYFDVIPVRAQIIVLFLFFAVPFLISDLAALSHRCFLLETRQFSSHLLNSIVECLGSQSSVK